MATKGRLRKGPPLFMRAQRAAARLGAGGFQNTSPLVYGPINKEKQIHAVVTAIHAAFHPGVF
jgi:hypothetical protein